MRHRSLAILLSILCVALATKTCIAATQHPETAAALQLLRNDEIRAARMYRAYARQAHTEKHLNIESFFAALGWSAMIRAEATAAVLNQMNATVVSSGEPDVRVSNTKFNLRLMTNVEGPKMDRRYPLLIEQIKGEGHAVAIKTVTHAWKVDQGHRRLAESILSSMESFFGIAARIPNEFHVCRSCGAVQAGVPELTCPICAGPFSDYGLAHAKWRFYRAINENSRLNAEEKAFAKRVYDHIHATSDPSENVTLARDAVYGEVYEKWGLGAPWDFCLEEKLYIAQLADMAHVWDTYKSINTHALDDADKAYLQEMRDKYGVRPINLRRERARERGKVAPEVQKVLEMVEIVSGRTEFQDEELILLRSLIAPVGFAG
ncbi:MAG: rubrerythrin family protein [Phycisphaerae bacterium]|nr:rubrerythrin family protein [Phycisphaerae bacterium]